MGKVSEACAHHREGYCVACHSIAIKARFLYRAHKIVADWLHAIGRSERWRSQRNLIWAAVYEGAMSRRIAEAGRAALQEDK